MLVGFAKFSKTCDNNRRYLRYDLYGMITTTLVNTILTPISLVLSLSVLGYSTRILFLYWNCDERRPIALVLAGVGILFSIFSIFSLVIYALSTFTGLRLSHILSGWRSLLMHLLIQGISGLMLQIYNDRI